MSLIVLIARDTGTYINLDDIQSVDKKVKYVTYHLVSSEVENKNQEREIGSNKKGLCI